MTLADKVTQFNTDADTFHAVVHGPATGAGSTVATEGGQVSTLAKVQADGIQAYGNAATNAAAAQTAALQAAAAARAYASTAAALGDATLAVGASFSAPLADGSLQAYTKTSGTVATPIGQPFIGAALLNSRLTDNTNSALPIGRNLFDKAAASDGFAMRATDGVPFAAGGFFITDYIKVIPGGQFITNRAIHGDAATYGVAFYGVGKAFLSGIVGAVAASTPVNVPATAAYVRFGVLGLANKVGMMMVHGGAIVPYVDHDFTNKYSQRQEFLGRVSEVLRAQPNLFNAATAKAGTIVSSTNGAESANAAWFATDYMPVYAGTIVFSETSTAGGGNGIAFYDSAKVFISGIAGPVVAGTQYAIPEGAYFARATFQNAAGNNSPRYKLQVYQATAVPAGFQEYGYTDPAGATKLAQAISLAYQDPSLNLFDRSRVTQAAAALLATGAVDASASYANYSITDYMAVKPGSTIVCSKDMNHGGLLGFVWYDRSKNYLTATTGNFAAGAPVTVPDSAFYVRCTPLTSYTTEFPLLEIYNAAALPATPGFGLQDWRLRSRWAGKNLILHGDSNTQSIDGKQQWARGVAYLLKANILANYAISGTKMAAALNGRVAADYANAHLVTIAFGTNDYNGAGSAGGVPIGAITDAPSVANGSSFYANGRYVIETLLAWNPALALAMYTPFRRGNDTAPNTLGYVLKDYRDAIIALAAMYSIPVCDMYMEAGFNSFNFATYMYQGDGLNLHPSNTGFSERVINRSARFLERI